MHNSNYTEHECIISQAQNTTALQPQHIAHWSQAEDGPLSTVNCKPQSVAPLRVPACLPVCLPSVYTSVSQPPDRGPVQGPDINDTGPREILLEFVILVF